MISFLPDFQCVNTNSFVQNCSQYTNNIYSNIDTVEKFRIKIYTTSFTFISGSAVSWNDPVLGSIEPLTYSGTSCMLMTSTLSFVKSTTVDPSFTRLMVFIPVG